MIRYEDPNEEIDMMHIELTERDDEDLYDAVLRYRNEHPEEEDKWEAKERLRDAAPDLYAFIERVAAGQSGELKGDFIANIRREAKEIIAKVTGKKEETL